MIETISDVHLLSLNSDGVDDVIDCPVAREVVLF